MYFFRHAHRLISFALFKLFDHALIAWACIILGLAVETTICAGCINVRPWITLTSNVAAVTAATAQTDYVYRGRFKIKYANQQGEKRDVCGNFEWHETDNTVTLQLRNLLGQTLAIVTSSPTIAMLQLPNRQVFTADNVSTLMQNILGFTLPIKELRYWPQPSIVSTTQTHMKNNPKQILRLKEIY